MVFLFKCGEGWKTSENENLNHCRFIIRSEAVIRSEYVRVVWGLGFLYLTEKAAWYLSLIKCGVLTADISNRS